MECDQKDKNQIELVVHVSADAYIYHSVSGGCSGAVLVCALVCTWGDRL